MTVRFVWFVISEGVTRPALVVKEYEDNVLALTVFGCGADGEDIVHHYSAVPRGNRRDSKAGTWLD